MSLLSPMNQHCKVLRSCTSHESLWSSCCMTVVFWLVQLGVGMPSGSTIIFCGSSPPSFNQDRSCLRQHCCSLGLATFGLSYSQPYACYRVPFRRLIDAYHASLGRCNFLSLSHACSAGANCCKRQGQLPHTGIWQHMRSWLPESAHRRQGMWQHIPEGG